VKAFLQRGGWWVLVQIVLLSSIVGAGFFGAGDWQFSDKISVLVVFLLGIGLVFLISGLVALGRFLTIFPEPLSHAELVRSGIYGVVRHPLYTSVIFCALAWSLWWNSLLSLILWGWTVVFLDAKARHEEVRLREKFEEYPDYASKVKRLIPWLY